MQYEENKETIKETFNVSFKENEIIPEKKTGKGKLVIAIISSILVLAVVSTLLIGYFKFHWFQNEIYRMDADIIRNVNQANFFTETKVINTKIALTGDQYEESNYKIDNNFMVFLNGRKEIGKKDYLNTASFVLLKSKLTYKEGEKDLPSFDLFDKEKLEEFNLNPDGSKYPVAFFSFYENGTINEIKLPGNMDKYNAETILELIEKVIPKLSRNRTEDEDKGLNIKTKTDRKKKTFIEEEKPKEYPTFRGSKYSRSVERDFEDDQLTNIRTTSNIHLKSASKEGEKIFGAKDFYYDTKSNIVSTEIKEEQKENGFLLGLISKRIKLIKAADLLKKFETKKEEEKTPSNMRNLGYSISAFQTFDIGKYDVLGQTVTVQYQVGVVSGNPINQIVIISSMGTTTIGNTGITLSGGWKETVTIFKFAFPAFPLVSIQAKASGSINLSVSLTSGSGSNVKLSASLSGKVSLSAEIKAGIDILLSYSAGVEGIIVNASGSAAISNGKVTKNFSISGGQIYIYLDKSVFGDKERVEEKLLYNGW